MKRIYFFVLFCLSSLFLFAQKENLAKTSAGFPVNYEEDSVAAYILPDVLTLSNGQKVTDKKTWITQRRPELLKLIEQIQYGKTQPSPADLHFDVFDKGTPVFNGTAIREQVTIYFTKDTQHKMDLLIYLPANATKPVPLLFTVSFAA